MKYNLMGWKAGGIFILLPFCDPDNLGGWGGRTDMTTGERTSRGASRRDRGQ